MDMALLQKYTEDKKFYELDDEVIITLENSSVKIAAKIVIQIERAVGQIQQKNKIFQTIGGVISEEEPIYFALKFVYEEDNTPYFFNLYKINSDKYLDLYNLNKIIK